MNGIIKYPGSKWSLAKWILSFFPEHHSYVEPFFGSGAILFSKPRSPIETVNDRDGRVVNLFEWTRKDPERLAKELYYTPYSRKVYEEAFRENPKDSFENAVNFLICLNMSIGMRTNGEKTGWKNDRQARARSYASREWCDLPEKILKAAERLRGVQIECRPALEVIRRFNYPNVLLYLDPPYMLETRRGRQYRYEMNEADHEELLEAAKQHKGPVLISGYDSELYRDSLKEWHREEAVAYSQIGTKKREILWMNFEPARQMCLFKEAQKWDD